MPITQYYNLTSIDDTNPDAKRVDATSDATNLICKYVSVGNTSARTSSPPDNVVWFIIYQIISDIIVLIKRYPTVETKHSTSFQFRYSPIKGAENCGLLSLRQGVSWLLRQFGNCLHERYGAGAASQRILLELPRLIGVPRAYPVRRTLFPCLIQCTWTMSPQRTV